MDVPRLEDLPWVHFPDFWPGQTEWPDASGRKGERTVYDILLEEIRPYLAQGTVVLYGSEHKEGRLTALFSTEARTMRYSGRSVTAVKPKDMSYLALLLETVRSEEFVAALDEMHPALRGKVPVFNAVFVNWYRPPPTTEGKVDALGWHSDDERSLTSRTILSMTFCEPQGEKLFAFQSKLTGKTEWECELKDGSGLVMLPGCQEHYKHSVSSRKTNSGGKIVGGRINLTFRQIELSASTDGKPTDVPRAIPWVGTTFFQGPEGENGHLSLLYPAEIRLVEREDSGILPTALHYIAWKEAMLFGDREAMKRVFSIANPLEVQQFRQLRRHAKNFDALRWKENRVAILLEANLAKFSQHEDLKAKLLATRDSILAETRGNTTYGLDVNASRGHNLLGKVLSEVRRRLGAWKSGLQRYADKRMPKAITTSPEMDYIAVWQMVTAEWRQFSEEEQTKWEL